jgi:hypothetical protein
MLAPLGQRGAQGGKNVGAQGRIPRRTAAHQARQVQRRRRDGRLRRGGYNLGLVHAGGREKSVTHNGSCADMVCRT